MRSHPSRYILFAFLLFVSSVFSAHAQKAFNPVKLFTKENKSTGEITFYAQNPGYSPYQLEVSFSELINYASSAPLPFYTVIQPTGEEVELLTLSPKKEGRMSYKVGYTFEHGDPTATPDLSKPFLFPYAHGTKFRMPQGYNGKFSHQGKYAVDFEMPVGTPVTAVRDGVVIDLKQDSERGGSDRAYIHDGNYIMVYHSDGTYATYSHIKKNGAAKKIGDTVKAGELVAYSGNTGWSIGPHLHLEILRPEKMALKTVPTTFINYDGKPVTLREGNFYYATHPGGPAFKVDEAIAASAEMKDPKAHRGKVATTNKVEVTEREIDGVLYFYLRNGFSSEKEVFVSFELENMKPLDKEEAKIKVPANTELYVFSAKIDNPAKPANFGFKISTR
jgi:murein DD-endopeptidase MepM/ murein hydrolase activator NlpD